MPDDVECTVSCTVNGADVARKIPVDLWLVELLRSELGLKGTNIGCDTTQCGACTVLMDGRPVKSCTVLAVQAEGRAITTIEGVTQPDGELSDIQQAFHEHHALQCGYCTSGMVMTAVSILADGKATDEATVRHWLEGNLCRCTGYQNIVSAILSVAAQRGAAA